MTSLRIYLAYASPDEHLAKELEKKLHKKGWQVITAISQGGYKKSISTLVPDAAQYDAVIILLSAAFVHDDYCMFEFLHLHKEVGLRERIFPVPADDLNLADGHVRLELVKYWEEQYRSLEEQIRDLDSLANIEGLTRDLNRYNAIRMQVADLTQLLKDMNLLNLQLHRDGNYRDLLDAIESQAQKTVSTPVSTSPPAVAPPPPSTQSFTPQKPPATKRTGQLVIGVVVLVLLAWLFFKYLQA